MREATEKQAEKVTQGRYGGAGSPDDKAEPQEEEEMRRYWACREGREGKTVFWLEVQPGRC